MVSGWYKVSETELDEETSSKFKYDKVILCNFPSENKLIFMSNDEEKLKNFYDGMAEMNAIWEELVKVREIHGH